MSCVAQALDCNRGDAITFIASANAHGCFKREFFKISVETSSAPAGTKHQLLLTLLAFCSRGQGSWTVHGGRLSESALGTVCC